MLTVAVTAQKPLREITEYADKVLRRQLESSDGVGQVLVIGGRNRQINLWLNAELLRAQNLTVNDVARALQTQNVEVPGGRIDQGAQSVTCGRGAGSPRSESSAMSSSARSPAIRCGCATSRASKTAWSRRARRPA